MPEHTRLPLKAQIRNAWRGLRTRWYDLRYGTGPESVPKRLNRQVLESLMQDADMLKSMGVDVRDLAPGEEPTQPKPAATPPPGYS